jgi:hypothetical protein
MKINFHDGVVMENTIKIAAADSKLDCGKVERAINRDFMRAAQVLSARMFERIEIIAIVLIWGASVAAGISVFAQLN